MIATFFVVQFGKLRQFALAVFGDALYAETPITFKCPLCDKNILSVTSLVAHVDPTVTPTSPQNRVNEVGQIKSHVGKCKKDRVEHGPVDKRLVSSPTAGAVHTSVLYKAQTYSLLVPDSIHVLSDCAGCHSVESIWACGDGEF